MSTKAAEDYEEQKERIPCKVCDGRFVPGGYKTPIPEGVCVWCFNRSHLYRRYTMLWEGLSYLAQTHQDDCGCKGCQIYKAALPIMKSSAKVQTSET